MSDNLRRYRAIRKALTQGYPGEPQGNIAKHFTTLAALISGMVASQSSQLPKIASKVPDGAKPESRVTRFSRWVDNAHISDEVYFLPYAEVLLGHLALETLCLVMDGSVVGRGGGAHDSRDLQGPSTALGLASTPREHGAFSRTDTHRSRAAASRAHASRRGRRLPWRWRM